MKPLLAFFALALCAAPLHAQEGKRVAIFDAAFLDTSTEGDYNGVRADEQARLALYDRLLRDAFAERGYTLLPLDPVQEVLDRTVNPAQCNNCEIRMGETLGADLVVTSQIQKVSNLILAFTLIVRDVETGAQLRGGSADIRGNTDRSWERGLRYLLRNRIFREDEAP